MKSRTVIWPSRSCCDSGSCAIPTLKAGKDLGRTVSITKSLGFRSMALSIENRLWGLSEPMRKDLTRGPVSGS